MFIVRSDLIRVAAVLCVSGLFFCIRSVSPIDVLTAAVGVDLRLDGGFNIHQLWDTGRNHCKHWQCSETSLSPPFVCLRRHSDKTSLHTFPGLLLLAMQFLSL